MPGKTKSPNLSFPSWRKMATARGHNGTRCYRAAFIRCGRLGAYCGRRRVCNVISGGQFSFSPALTRTRSHRYQSADDCPAANAVGERDSRCAIATAIVCVSGTTSGYVRRRSKETKESKRQRAKVAAYQLPSVNSHVAASGGSATTVPLTKLSLIDIVSGVGKKAVQPALKPRLLDDAR
jgi:hypothetical protein